MREYIVESMEDSIALKRDFLGDTNNIEKIEEIAEVLLSTLKKGGKIIFCGNGGSAADAQHLAAEFVGRFLYERCALPAIAITTDTSILTAIGNDYGFDHIFDRQVVALANEGDILFVLSTSGNSKNLTLALQRALLKGVTTIGLLGRDGGECKELCKHSIVVNSQLSARIQELHITIGHILCGIVDNNIIREDGRIEK